jgi:hypothetical protein
VKKWKAPEGLSEKWSSFLCTSITLNEQTRRTADHLPFTVQDDELNIRSSSAFEGRTARAMFVQVFLLNTSAKGQFKQQKCKISIRTLI